MQRQLTIRLWFALTAGVVMGCASTPSNVQSRFDEENGLTWVSMDEAIVLARAAPQYTVAARDYLYVGPMEINRMGMREHYLWLGTASTVDRALRGDTTSGAVTLLLIVDGHPVALPLTSSGGELDASPYEVSVPISSSQRARVSLDQIHRIAEADTVEVHVALDTGTVARYELWRGAWPTWRAFAAEH